MVCHAVDVLTYKFRVPEEERDKAALKKTMEAATTEFQLWESYLQKVNRQSLIIGKSSLLNLAYNAEFKEVSKKSYLGPKLLCTIVSSHNVVFIYFFLKPFSHPDHS